MTTNKTITGSGRTVAYLRTASANQIDGRLGLARQQDACESYARSLGVRISRIYADVGESGTSERRPLLTQLMSDLSRGGIRRVIVAGPARLARSQELEARLTIRIRRYGASLAIPCLKEDE